MNKKQLVIVKEELDKRLRESFVKGLLEGSRITSTNVIKWIEQGKTKEELLKLVRGMQGEEFKRIVKGVKHEENK